MKDALTGEGFSEHANHKTEHGGATIKSSTRWSCSAWIWRAAAA
jgi:hypothetical protein